jgi:O-antigen/teichoic acid export membrane protein
MQSLSGRIGSFASQLILAKLLMPEAFGAIGLAFTVATLANAFVSFGIDDILLQRLRAIYLWVAPAFWASLAGGLIGMTVMMAAAPFAARMYGNTGLIGLIAILAINLPIGALATVPTVKLRGAMNFKFLGVYASIETASLQVATVVLALLGFGAYSFILPLPVASVIKLAVFWRKAPTRIRFRFRRVQFLHIISSSFLVQGSRVLVELVNQGDYIVLGLLTSDATVGVYYFAFRLAAQPLWVLAGNFNSVLFPALVQLRSDPARQERAALGVARILAYTVTPVCFLQAAVAEPVLHLMFGAKWNAAVPLVQLLSLGLPGDASAWVSGAFLVARREFKRDFIYLLIFSIGFFILVVTGALLASSLGVAIAVAVYYAAVKPINSWLVFRASMRLPDFLQIYIFPAAISGIAIGAAYACSHLPIVTNSYVEQIAVTVVLGPLIYLGMLRLLVPETLRDVLDRFPAGSLLRRLKRRVPASQT